MLIQTHFKCTTERSSRNSTEVVKKKKIIIKGKQKICSGTKSFNPLIKGNTININDAFYRNQGKDLWLLFVICHQMKLNKQTNAYMSIYK